MSRSTKKPIIKDAPRNAKKSALYWRAVRKGFKRAVNRLARGEEVEIPSHHSLVNDYDYSDYTVIPYDEESKKKFKRK